MASLNPANRVILYDLANDRALLTLPPEANDITCLNWSPDGKRLAVGLSGGGLTVWSLEEVRARLAEFGIAVPSTAVRQPIVPAVPPMSEETFRRIRAGERPAPSAKLAAVTARLEANRASREGRHRDAVEVLRQAVEAHPTDASLRDQLAEMLIHSPDETVRDPAEAARQAARAVQLAPGESRYHMRLGIALHLTGDWKTAVPALKKGMARSFSAHAAFHLAMSHARLGEKEEAQKWHAAAAAATDLGKSAPSEEHQKLRAESAQLLGLPDGGYQLITDNQERLAACQRILEADPGIAWAYSQRGGIYRGLRRWKEMASDYAKVVELDPDVPLAFWPYWADAHLSVHDLDGFRKVCRAMVGHLGQTQHLPTATVAYICVAAPNALDDWAPLTQLVERAAADVPPEQYTIHKGRPAGVSDMERAYRESLPVRVLGAVLYRAGQHQRAAEILQDLDRISPLGRSDRLFLAMALHQRGRPDEALKHLEKALEGVKSNYNLSEHSWSGAWPMTGIEATRWQYLRREAEKLVGKPAKPSAASPGAAPPRPAIEDGQGIGTIRNDD